MQILLNGEAVAAKPVQIVKSHEQVSDFLLEDGTVLKVRTIITGVYKFQDKVDAMGNPLYHVNWHVIPITEPGESP